MLQKKKKKNVKVYVLQGLFLFALKIVLVFPSLFWSSQVTASARLLLDGQQRENALLHPYHIFISICIHNSQYLSAKLCISKISKDSELVCRQHLFVFVIIKMIAEDSILRS